MIICVVWRGNDHERPTLAQESQTLPSPEMLLFSVAKPESSAQTFSHHPFCCRVTILLTSSSVSTFSTLHNLSNSKQQPANASSDSASPASCCYILLHTHTNSSAPAHDRTKVVLSSMGHAMLLMGTALGLCGRWVAELQVRFDALD